MYKSKYIYVTILIIYFIISHKVSWIIVAEKIWLILLFILNYYNRLFIIFHDKFLTL